MIILELNFTTTESFISQLEIGNKDVSQQTMNATINFTTLEIIFLAFWNVVTFLALHFSWILTRINALIFLFKEKRTNYYNQLIFYRLIVLTSQ